MLFIVMFAFLSVGHQSTELDLQSITFSSCARTIFLLLKLFKHRSSWSNSLHSFTQIKSEVKWSAITLFSDYTTQYNTWQQYSRIVSSLPSSRRSSSQHYNHLKAASNTQVSFVFYLCNPTSIDCVGQMNLSEALKLVLKNGSLLNTAIFGDI